MESPRRCSSHRVCPGTSGGEQAFGAPKGGRRFTPCFFAPQCEKCNLHFRHKSQLRLHLRQKHGAITNTKVQYRVSGSEVPPELPKAC